MSEELCKHCGGKISIRLPIPKSGCDHLYYPDNCSVCSEKNPTDTNLLKEEIDRLKRTLIDTEKLCAKLSKQNVRMYEALNLITAFCGRPVEFEETPSNKGEVNRLLRDIIAEAREAMKGE